jgi:predicted AAA+ superfamily ATPase
MTDDLIIRRKYHEQLVPFIGKQLIKVLTGQRRSGKSYILKQTMAYIRESDVSAHILYINKEDLRFDTIRTAGDTSKFLFPRCRTANF